VDNFRRAIMPLKFITLHFALKIITVADCQQNKVGIKLSEAYSNFVSQKVLTRLLLDYPRFKA